MDEEEEVDDGLYEGRIKKVYQDRKFGFIKSRQLPSNYIRADIKFNFSQVVDFDHNGHLIVQNQPVTFMLSNRKSPPGKMPFHSASNVFVIDNTHNFGRSISLNSSTTSGDEDNSLGEEASFDHVDEESLTSLAACGDHLSEDIACDSDDSSNSSHSSSDEEQSEGTVHGNTPLTARSIDSKKVVDTDSGEEKSMESIHRSHNISTCSDHVDYSNCPDIPVFATCEELLADNLNDPYLSHTPLGSPYKSVEAYLEALFRLTRIECFDAVQRGIKSILSRCQSTNSDTTEFRVYTNVSLVGIDATREGLELGIQFMQLAPVEDWEKVMDFLPGNMLVLSPSGQFCDCIWATVARRCIRLAAQNQIFIRLLCPIGSSHEPVELIRALWSSNGTTKMVETFNHFPHHIANLTNIQKLLDNEIPELLEEVACGRQDTTVQTPPYLKRHTVNAQCIGIEFKGPIEKMADKFRAVRQTKDMSIGHLKALKHIFTHSLSIIHSPPGSKEPFLVSKLIQLLNSSSEFSNSPVVIVAQNRSSLDQTLHCLKNVFSDEKVVSFEGMNDLLLSSTSESEVEFLKSRLPKLLADLQGKLHLLNSKVNLSILDIIERLTDSQLMSLLLEAPYEEENDYGVKVDSTFYGMPTDDSFVQLEISKIGNLKKCLLAINEDKKNTEIRQLFCEVLKVWLPAANVSQHAQSTTTQDESTFVDESLFEFYSLEQVPAFMTRIEFDSEVIQSIISHRCIPKHLLLESDSFVLIDNGDRELFDKNIFSEIVFQMAENSPPSAKVNNTKSMWNLNDAEKRALLESKADKVSSSSGSTASLTKAFNDLTRIIKQLQRSTTASLVKMAKSKKQKVAIGFTITEACLNTDFLRKLDPSTVIVLDAGQISETNLLTIVSPGLKHLILMGDNCQLRPHAEVPKLREDYQFPTSMIDRLIQLNYPCRKLQCQPYMRAELSQLLSDIYPKIDYHAPSVDNLIPIASVTHPVFFWSHATAGESTSIRKVMALISFLLGTGMEWSEIAVVPLHQSQTSAIRKEIERSPGEHSRVSVSTIEHLHRNYPVVIAMIAPPIIEDMNRRCTMQSKATRALYFIGNETLLEKSVVWTPILNKLKEIDCLATHLSVQCPNHTKLSRFLVESGDDLKKYIPPGSTQLCNRPCRKPMLCNVADHLCLKPCLPVHDHALCTHMVTFDFPGCSHASQRKCHEVGRNSGGNVCSVEITVKLKRCQHVATKLCHQPESEVRCTHNCSQMMNCGNHKCSQPCYPVHDHNICKTPVDFKFPVCGHPSLNTKPCYEDPKNLLCKTNVESMCPQCHHKSKDHCYAVTSGNIVNRKCSNIVDFQFPNCKHKSQKECWQPVTESECQEPCPKKLDCGIHNCINKCGQDHLHACFYEIKEKAEPCGHTIIRFCRDPAICRRPCQRERDCGHPCKNLCGEDCKKTNCHFCHVENAAILETGQKEAADNFKKIEKEIKEAGEVLRIEPIAANGNTLNEYNKVKDIIEKYVKPEHNWVPIVTKIEKITNLKLERNFYECKKKAFNPISDLKFHGTNLVSKDLIIKDGFKIPVLDPTKRPSMYGNGIYFATDSSKSAQQIYTKNSECLLLCEVLIGNCKVLDKEDRAMSLARLQAERCDSVYAPRDSKVTGGVLNDEYVVFDPRQAVPRYVIYYKSSLPNLQMQENREPFVKINCKATRLIGKDNLSDSYYRFAESHFYRMMSKEFKIDSIDIVINQKLQEKWDQQQLAFEKAGVNSNKILAYHGTPVENIDKILRDNLSITHARRQAYGRGNYFSEFPDTSLGYGAGLLLCELLVGNEFVDKSNVNIPQGYHSKSVAQNDAKFGGFQMIIIENSDQIFPRWVIHLKK